jgi:hypothetical protein
MNYVLGKPQALDRFLGAVMSISLWFLVSKQEDVPDVLLSYCTGSIEDCSRSKMCTPNGQFMNAEGRWDDQLGMMVE